MSDTGTAPAKILVVDDTPANVKLLVDVLTARGFAVPVSLMAPGLRASCALSPGIP